MLERIIYCTACVVVMLAVFNLQHYRHAGAKGCLWWSWNVVAFALGWEAIAAWLEGAPPFPSPRWLLVFGLAFVLTWAAVVSWRSWRERQDAAAAVIAGRPV
jgi:hypothetical protein